jgi:hypothetical protein
MQKSVAGMFVRIYSMICDYLQNVAQNERSEHFMKNIPFCGISGFHTGGYEEFYLV